MPLASATVRAYMSDDLSHHFTTCKASVPEIIMTIKSVTGVDVEEQDDLLAPLSYEQVKRLYDVLVSEE